MNHTGFYSKTRTREELNRHHAQERERLSGGTIGNARLSQPGGTVPPRSPARASGERMVGKHLPVHTGKFF